MHARCMHEIGLPCTVHGCYVCMDKGETMKKKINSVTDWCVLIRKAAIKIQKKKPGTANKHAVLMAMTKVMGAK